MRLAINGSNIQDKHKNHITEINDYDQKSISKFKKH